LYDCQVIETTYAGYLPDPQRLIVKIDSPVRDWILWWRMNKLKNKDTEWYKRALKKCYRPIEINVVVKKPSNKKE